MPTPTNIPLQLDEFFLSKLHVDWRTNPSVGEITISSLNLKFSYEVAMHVNNEHAYQMTLTVLGEEESTDAPGCGFQFEAVMVGQYHIENVKPDLEQFLARVNGVSLLYSTFRGIIGMATGVFQHGKLVLPSIDPRAIVEQVEARKKVVAQPTAAGVAEGSALGSEAAALTSAKP